MIFWSKARFARCCGVTSLLSGYEIGKKFVSRTHIKLFFRSVTLMRYDSDIDRAATRVARTAGNIAFLEQVTLGNVWIVIGFCVDILEIFSPVNEVIYRSLWSVRIENLEP